MARVGISIYALSVFAAALLARAPALDLFPTQDEDNWMDRGSEFGTALSEQDWHATYRSGHPGVTTMWLATLGMGHFAEPLVNRADRQVTRAPEFMPALEAARHAMILFNSAVVALIAFLTGRLFGWAPAFFAGGLLAFEPFLVAHGQVVHLDALVSGLMAIALLAAATRWLNGGHAGLLGLSAVAGGMAFVTKSPSAFLVLAVPVIAAIGIRPWHGLRQARAYLIGLIVWAGIAGVTALAIWPAFAMQPIDTISRVIRFTLAEGGQPHGPGNFFMGEPVSVPGPLFYPVALLYRLTPATMVGILALAVFSWWRKGVLRSTSSAWVLIGLVIAFAVFMNLGAKKLDRYILPAVPLIDVLAGCGLWAGTHWLLMRTKDWQGYARLVMALPLAILLFQPIAWQSVLPYPLSYYSPILGGGAAAQRMLLVGWGEGLDQAAAYINAQPDGASATVAVYFPLTVNFQALLQGTAVSYGSNVTPTYVVDYINARQRNQVPAQVVGKVPEYVVKINGIDYARVYRW
jgi:4-amino-4-deoxy-L-arabinose transferase-like glycosyltransferase